MRFALATLGSTGDLYPFLAIGRALAEQGHEVFLLSQAPYGPDAERAGLRFIPVADTAAHQRTLAHPKLWHPVDGLGVFWRHLCLPAARPTWDALRSLCDGAGQKQPLRVLASPLAVGARLARDTAPIRLWTAYLSPAALRNLDEPMFLGPWRLPSWVPMPWRRMAWDVLDRWKLEPMARDALSRLAGEVGAKPPEGSVFGDWVHSPDGGLALYDALFAPIPRHLAGSLGQSHRRALLRQAGFPNFEWETPLADPSHAPAALAPWVIFGGSADTHGVDRARRLAQALVARSGRPCVLLERRPSAQGSAHAEGVIHLPLQALPPLLRQAHAFIHHGGIGSCAQGLAAGVPQFLLPKAYDQFENAAAIHRMGAGWVIPPSIARSTDERQAHWIATRPLRRGAQPAPAPYSVPGAPNTAVAAAVGLLTVE
ncbi:nucleotide disphospho-sugar-binding domain-containing protein [Ideonella oryzae]|uniref:Glycosyltransferase n=1 Tax=Ideonella oryzae TaxID=2937441 RepID=A0ABT1BMN7_9BURK|nr:nucleotide disphospho-sugar-binding domain-containing protein [Ideonella oryzae]MCO5977484.1 glycosyltransferase [Ideonella oryzae]